MATQSSVLAWRIPGTAEPGGLPSIGSPRVRHDWSDLAAAAAAAGAVLLSGKESTCQCRRPGFDPWVWKIPWRRKWQPTPVVSPGKPRGWRSLVSYSSWGHRETDTPERLHMHTGALLCYIFSICAWIFQTQVLFRGRQGRNWIPTWMCRIEGIH